MKYAFTRNCFENWEKEQMECVGKFDIPMVNPTDVELNKELELVRFDFSRKLKEDERKGKGIHFFIDDYKFIAVWREPEKYVDFLKTFDFVVAPDFSVYIDFPFALQVLAHYRRQWLTAFWQSKGINVIPDVSWSDERSFEYCFDGIPQKSVVAVSSAGMCQSNFDKKLLNDGWKKMMDVLQPQKIILYGNKTPEMTGNIIQVKPYQELWRDKK